jgi:endoglucanase
MVKSFLHLGLTLALAAGAVEASALAQDAAAVNKRMGRGINLGNALEAPKEGDWGVKLKAEYFKAIKDAGFATVRLPVRWSAHAQDTLCDRSGVRRAR